MFAVFFLVEIGFETAFVTVVLERFAAAASVGRVVLHFECESYIWGANLGQTQKYSYFYTLKIFDDDVAKGFRELDPVV